MTACVRTREHIESEMISPWKALLLLPLLEVFVGFVVVERVGFVVGRVGGVGRVVRRGLTGGGVGWRW